MRPCHFHSCRRLTLGTWDPTWHILESSWAVAGPAAAEANRGPGSGVGTSTYALLFHYCTLSLRLSDAADYLLTD